MAAYIYRAARSAIPRIEFSCQIPLGIGGLNLLSYTRVSLQWTFCDGPLIVIPFFQVPTSCTACHYNEVSLKWILVIMDCSHPSPEDGLMYRYKVEPQYRKSLVKSTVIHLCVVIMDLLRWTSCCNGLWPFFESRFHQYIACHYDKFSLMWNLVIRKCPRPSPEVHYIATCL